MLDPLRVSFIFLVFVLCTVFVSADWTVSSDGTNIFLFENQNLSFIHPYLFSNVSSVFFNESKLNETIISLGVIIDTDTNLSGGGVVGGSLTVTGELIVSAVSTTKNIFPVTNGLYNLGNISNRWDNLYVNNAFVVNLNASNITSGSVRANSLDASSINSSSVASDELVTTNMSLAGFQIKKSGDSMVVVLS